METLVASVLIVVVFIVASMILNNVFMNSIKSDTHAIESYMNELEYRYRSGTLTVPFNDDFEGWEINVDYDNSTGIDAVIFTAQNNLTNKNIERLTYAN